MRVLVTGGNGWIGKYVCAELVRQGHEPARFDKVCGHDVRNRQQVFANVLGADAVIHLAGVLGTHELFNDPQLAVDVNVSGTLNVLDACVDTGASFVGISMPDVNPSIYSATKVCAQRLAEAYRQAYKLGVSHVVAYNAYGPGQAYGGSHPRKIIPTFSVAGWKGEPLEVWGTGTLNVDLVHVEDVAAILVAATKLTNGQVLHAGTGHGVSVAQVAKKVQEWTGGKSELSFIAPRQGERRKPVDGEVAPLTETSAALGWLPEFSWDRIRETVESYKK